MQTLSCFAAITISGADAKSFLQGQLSNDISLLSPQRALLASCNSAQGRVQAVVTLIERQEDIVAILPESMSELFAARLRKYILRSKVTVTKSRDRLRCVTGTSESLNVAQLPIPSTIGECTQLLQTSVLRWWDKDAARYLIVQPPSTVEVEDSLATNAAWTLNDIRAGIPHVLPPTHEAFVAQMLNLDVLDGISFSKGCYTGQEIIARAHYRGAVKRRMFRLSVACPPPTPATRILTVDGTHAGDVVISAAADSGCELLAVLSLNHLEAASHLEGNAAVLKMESLPYSIPSLA